MHFIDPHHTPIDLEEIFKQIQAQLDLINNHEDDNQSYFMPPSSTSFQTDMIPLSPSTSESIKENEFPEDIDFDEDLLNELFSLMKESLGDLLDEDERFIPTDYIDDVFDYPLEEYDYDFPPSLAHEELNEEPFFITFKGNKYLVEPITDTYIPEYYGDWESFFLIN